LHFAEFHSDDSNKKDTALISATSDPIRALKKAFMKWYHGNFTTRDPGKIFISIFHSSEYYDAQELVEMARKPPLCFRLSRESCDRLNSPKLEHLHDSEAVFLHVIPKEDLVINLSLQDLFDRGLKDILPELCNKDTTCNKFLWPKAIRAKISLNNESNFHKVAVQLRRMYCMFTQNGRERTVESLTNAQELFMGDPFVLGEVKEEGFRILQDEIDMMVRPKPRRVRLKPTMLDEDQNKDEP
jgi:hypothetical protein